MIRRCFALRFAAAMFTGISAVSMLLCTTSGVLVVRSRYVSDSVLWDTGRAQWSVMANWGLVCVSRVEPNPSQFGGRRVRYEDWEPIQPTSAWVGLLGFGDRSGVLPPLHSPQQFWQRTLTAPLWAFVLAFAVAPAVWTRRHVRRRRGTRRLAEGLCPSCGYDLRESPGRCPECGCLNAETATTPKQSPMAGV